MKTYRLDVFFIISGVTLMMGSYFLHPAVHYLITLSIGSFVLGTWTSGLVSDVMKWDGDWEQTPDGRWLWKVYMGGLVIASGLSFGYLFSVVVLRVIPLPTTAPGIALSLLALFSLVLMTLEIGYWTRKTEEFQNA